MLKFYMCSICGNIVELVVNNRGTLKCCEKEMIELIPKEEDMLIEKHVPDVSISNNKVRIKIGKEKHPSENNHHVMFIVVETNKRIIRKNLKANVEPCFEIVFDDDEYLLNVYEYCNLHGLWTKRCTNGNV